MLCLAALGICKYTTILKYTYWFRSYLIKNKKFFILYICLTSLYNLCGNVWCLTQYANTICNSLILGILLLNYCIQSCIKGSLHCLNKVKEYASNNMEIVRYTIIDVYLGPT